MRLHRFTFKNEAIWISILSIAPLLAAMIVWIGIVLYRLYLK